ncbi:hypothetical protein QFC21_002289 [Naganishia friedmannii]|uniref:Uncharacterized protein n=1 Tax=Naganishia friedmannii TaxID=89922 RepID=A0ACC2VY79_9TREE|nr:hypothetical protein QFC21_002289 [Naganishia friedmannii]
MLLQRSLPVSSPNEGVRALPPMTEKKTATVTSSTDLSLQQAHSPPSPHDETDGTLNETTTKSRNLMRSDITQSEEGGINISTGKGDRQPPRPPRDGLTSTLIRGQLQEPVGPRALADADNTNLSPEYSVSNDHHHAGTSARRDAPPTETEAPMIRRTSVTTEARPYHSNVSSACAAWETQIHEHEKMQSPTHQTPLIVEPHDQPRSETDHLPARHSRTDVDPGAEASSSKLPSSTYAFPLAPPELNRTASGTQSISFSQTSSSVALSNAAANRELTSKGKKRKRLAKACSACHKNKRRCDGFAPCSNCEFSSRRCVYLSSKGEAIPPPKTREGSISGTSAAVAHDIEASDTHSLSYALQKRHGLAESSTARSETSHAPLLHDTFKRPHPPGSYPGSTDARSTDMRRASQATASSAYSERPVSLMSPMKPWTTEATEGHAAYEPRITDHSSRPSFSDGHREAFVAPTSEPFHPTAQRFPRSSFPYASPPRASMPQVVDRLASADFRLTSAKLRAVERQALFVEELVHTFFARLHPYQLMFHQPTFQYRRYLGLVPTALLHIIYALSIRFVDPVQLHDALIAEHATQAELDLPLFLAGEVFFEEARKATDVWLKQKRATMRRASWSTTNLQTWEDLEMLMAITLCGFYEKAMRRMQDAAQDFDSAIDLLRQNLSISSSRNVNESHPDAITLRQCTERTLWMLYLADVSVGIHVRPRQLLDYQMSNIPLPTNEAEFSWRGGSRTAGDPRELAFGVEALNLPGSAIANADISEFGHLIRSASILFKIMALFGQASHDRTETSKRAVVLEAELRAWASCLPEHLQFNDRNFVLNVKKLGSAIPTTASCGFCFALMHSIAESSQFYLQSIAAIAGDISHSITATRQSQAVDNMTVVIDTIGDIGRQSPEAFAILDIVSTWAAHTAGTLPTGRLPSLTTQRNEMRLEQWWSDLGHTWGLRRQSSAYQSHENMGPNPTHHPTLRHASHHTRPAPREAETHPNMRYDRPGRSEMDTSNQIQRPHYEHYATENRLLQSRAPHTRDLEDGDVLSGTQSSKKRRFSAGPSRPIYAEPPPPIATSAESAKMPSGLAALLTAAEHRGLK